MNKTIGPIILLLAVIGVGVGFVFLGSGTPATATVAAAPKLGLIDAGEYPTWSGHTVRYRIYRSVHGTGYLMTRDVCTTINTHVPRVWSCHATQWLEK